MVILGSLMQVPLFFVNTVTDAAALLFTRGSGYLSVFDKPQHDAFARLFLDLAIASELLGAALWLFVPLARYRLQAEERLVRRDIGSRLCRIPLHEQLVGNVHEAQDANHGSQNV
jgi:hypothetical protein